MTIPEDIMREAEQVRKEAAITMTVTAANLIIARALLAAEKRGAERAAKVCDRVAAEASKTAKKRTLDGDQHGSILHMEREQTAERLAVAIRIGEK